MITEPHRTPPVLALTDGNHNDITQLSPLVKAVPAVWERCRGRPLHLSQRLDADRGYDHDTHRRLLRASPCQ